LASVERNSEKGRRTVYLLHIGYAHANLGRPDVGLGSLDEAIQTAETTDEKSFEAELYRQRGEILLSLGKKRDGEAALQQALTIARGQEARWWELRAATDLAQHFCEQGRHTEADALLRPLFDWFTEGLETSPDLKRARAILDQLGSLQDGDSGRRGQQRNKLS
jgi:predicted ATPase